MAKKKTDMIWQPGFGRSDYRFPVDPDVWWFFYGWVVDAAGPFPVWTDLDEVPESWCDVCNSFWLGMTRASCTEEEKCNES
jgi:hypothetical protein